MKDQVFAARVGWLATDASEESGEPVVIVLAPAFEGMVMTLGALHANAEKQLRDILHLLLSVL